jgi:hypothetical protein
VHPRREIPSAVGLFRNSEPSGSRRVHYTAAVHLQVSTKAASSRSGSARVSIVDLQVSAFGPADPEYRTAC